MKLCSDYLSLSIVLLCKSIQPFERDRQEMRVIQKNEVILAENLWQKILTESNSFLWYHLADLGHNHLATLARAYYAMEYGMEGKNRYGMWNGTENLMYGMEKIFHIPYLHTLTSRCWSPVFLSVKHSCRVLSSTRTVIRELTAFFAISGVTNSNVDTKRRSLVLILTLLSWDIMARGQNVYFRAANLPLCKTR